MKMENLKVRVKTLDGGVTPKYTKSLDAGMDCVARERIVTDKYVAYKLGFKIEIPHGYVGLLFPRSSVSKKDLSLANSVGVIDETFRGEVEARFKATRFGHCVIDSYEINERVAQLIILPRPIIELEETSELSDSERGETGFGYSGK